MRTCPHITAVCQVSDVGQYQLHGPRMLTCCVLLGYIQNFSTIVQVVFEAKNKGCARAHVQQYDTFWSFVSVGCVVTGYMRNFSPIGPVVPEIQKRGAHVRTCSGMPSFGLSLVSAVR